MTRTLNAYPSLELNPDAIKDKLSFSDVFGRSAPVHIEVGSGKGTFLVHEASSFSDRDYLGIEWASKYYRYAVDRIGRRGLTNVRMIRTDAAVFLHDHVSEESVTCFHIYFPDPWPKKRHNKRRFFNEANLELLLRLLKPQGMVRIATDHEDYFQQIQRVIVEHSERLEEALFPPTAGANTGEWVGTNFERKYLKEERSIYKVAVKKKP
jgi:tRNA (guanine-N7-)-methyltransferase